MSQNIQQLSEILQTAIKVEINGYETFKKFAISTADEHGKKMFERLAADEIEHQQILETQLKRLKESGQWHPVIIPKSKVENLLPAIREKQKRTKGQSGLGEVDALKAALDLEKKAAAFFREKADEVDDPEAKASFLRLAEWEDSHFELIQAELDHINNTGVWFGIPEFRMDGAF